MKLNQQLLALKSKPIWFCNKIKVIKSDLHSLYESYLDSRLRLTWFERQNEILFSFESEQGPYFQLTSMKWFDNEVFSQFVMKKILVEQYTLRSFRLNANIPLSLKLDNDVIEYSEKIQIHQLSEVGVILKIKDKKFLNKIKNSTMLEFQISLNHYKDIGIYKIEDAFRKLDEQQDIQAEKMLTFRLESRILNFYGNMNNANRSNEEEFHLFARYEDLIPLGHETQLQQLFCPLVKKTKDYFEKSLRIA